MDALVKQHKLRSQGADNLWEGMLKVIVVSIKEHLASFISVPNSPHYYKYIWSHYRPGYDSCQHVQASTERILHMLHAASSTLFSSVLNVITSGQLVLEH